MNLINVTFFAQMISYKTRRTKSTENRAKACSKLTFQCDSICRYKGSDCVLCGNRMHQCRKADVHSTMFCIEISSRQELHPTPPHTQYQNVYPKVSYGNAVLHLHDPNWMHRSS